MLQFRKRSNIKGWFIKWLCVIGIRVTETVDNINLFIRRLLFDAAQFPNNGPFRPGWQTNHYINWLHILPGFGLCTAYYARRFVIPPNVLTHLKIE
jgi:hypothetical protein